MQHATEGTLREPMSARVNEVLLNVVAAGYATPHRVRIALMRRCGISVGENTIVLSRAQFEGGGHASIGSGCWIGTQCAFDTTAAIEIGDNVFIAQRADFITATHEFGPSSKRAGKQLHQPVRIGDGCWVGARVTILPGVSVGAGCVLAAGAVVTRDCEPNGLYAGVPARRVRDLAAG